MEHRLAGVVAKFSRAKEQFDELIVEMEAFFGAEPQPYGSVGEFDVEAWEWVERFQVREKPPLRLGVIFGDCLHNLRSALDHLAWQITLLDGGTPNDETQFPIASKSEKQFDAMAARRIPGFSAKHLALVKRAQPYRAGDRAQAHPLAVLATLSNADKHKIVHPTYSFLDADTREALDRVVGRYPEGAKPPPVASIHMVQQGTRLTDGTPWFRVRFRPGEEAPRKVQMDAELPLGVAFGEIGLDAGEFPKIAEAVRSIMQAFLPDFPETEVLEAEERSDGH